MLSQNQSQSNEKSLVQFDYEKAVSNYLDTQSTFNAPLPMSCAALHVEYAGGENTIRYSVHI